MDPGERIFKALGGERTDRIPTFSLIGDPNIANQVLGREPGGLLEYLNSERGIRFVDRRAQTLSRYFNPFMFFLYHTGIRVNYLMGFDSLWVGYWRFKIRNHAEIEDAFGRVFDLVDDGYGNVYFMYREGPIRSPEEWRRWPRPDIAGYALTGLWMYKMLNAIWRKKIALIPFVGPGLWENSWQPMGLPRYISLMKRDPGFAREVIDYFTTLSVACVDAYGKAGARIMSYGDDLAYKAGPMLSPEMLEEFYGNGYRQITDTAHRHGARIFIHCCGNTNELVEKFVEWGFDGAHAFEPTAMNDLAEARRKVGDKLCLIGNIDVTHTLVDGTKEEVEGAVRKAIEDSRGGGFILAPTHSHASISVKNVRWMLEAGRRYIG